MTTAADRAERPERWWARRNARRALGLAASLLVLGFLVAGVIDGWGTVSSYDWQLEPGLLVGGILVLGVFYLLGGGLYVAIVERLVHHHVPRRGSLSAWARSLLGRYVPGSVLMVVGRAVMGQAAGISRRVTLAATAYEQILNLAAAAIGALAFLAFYSDLGKGAVAWVVAVAPLLLVLLHPRIFRRASTIALRRAGREPLERFLAPRDMAVLLAGYAVQAVVLGAAVWLPVRSAAGPAAGGPAFVGLAFLFAFTLSTLAIVFPSGLGLREGLFALALAQHLPNGVAVTLSVGLRLVLTAVELGFVGVCALLGRGAR
jgi:glycosyltransferase 2 family protein